MTNEEARAYMAQLKRAAPLIEQVRRQELRDFDHAKHAEQIDQLLALGLLHAKPRTTTGLIELQRLFARTRR